jgi:hypothetical protein
LKTESDDAFTNLLFERQPDGATGGISLNMPPKVFRGWSKICHIKVTHESYFNIRHEVFARADHKKIVHEH